MKRAIAVTVALLSMLPIPVASETILLYTVDGATVPDTTLGESYIIPAIEDGAMGIFFEASHIIFNDRHTPGEPQEPDQLLRNSLLVAKRGGAQLLVEVELLYPGDLPPPHPLPDGFVITVTDVAEGTVLWKERKRSNLMLLNFDGGPGINRMYMEWGIEVAEMGVSIEKCKYLGERIAELVLGLIGSSP